MSGEKVFYDMNLQTIFYKEEKGKPREEIVPSLTRGTALLHRLDPFHSQSCSDSDAFSRHGQECMLHEGSPVMSGTKYVPRTDLMFIC